MIRRTLFKGGTVMIGDNHWDGILQWEREIGLNSKYSKWEIIAKEQGKGEILHKLA